MREDFLCGSAKLSESGVVLFHDTQVRGTRFRRLSSMGELAEQYPSFEFHHGHGLEYWRLSQNVPEPVGALHCCRARPATAELVRSTYAKIGGGYAWQLGMADTRANSLRQLTRGCPLRQNATPCLPTGLS